MTLLAIFILCAIAAPSAQPTLDEREPKSERRDVRTNRGHTAMTVTTCADAHTAIATRQFADWRGLPAGCRPEQLVGVAFSSGWGVRQLGETRESARMHVLDVSGYYRPLVNVRDGKVVMIDGMNPELASGWAKLKADLGTPDAHRDFVFGSTPMAGGEHVYASRGITVFVNPENQFVLYVALYIPTTVSDYLARLQPDLTKSQ